MEKSVSSEEQNLSFHNENLNQSADSMSFSSLGPSIHMQTTNTIQSDQINSVEFGLLKMKSDKSNQTRIEAKNFVKQPLKGSSSLPIYQATHESQSKICSRFL